MILFAVIAVLVFVSVPLFNVAMEPQDLAASLRHQTAGWLMMICTFGLIGFPLVFAGMGILILGKLTSPFRIMYAFVAFVVAVVSVPIAYLIAGACAMQIAG